MLEKFRVEVTKSGKPAMWESGGGATNTGFAIIVADQKGSPKRPLYIRRHGELSNAEHALVPLKKGDYIVYTERYHDKYYTKVFRVVGFGEEPNFPGAENPIRHFAECHQLVEIPSFLFQAIEAGKRKSGMYHCREAVFVAS